MLAKDALAACRGNANLQDNLQIVADMRESYHEMIVCGGLQLDLSDSLVNVIARAAYQSAQRGPAQLKYRGNGLFATDNHMMSIQLALADGAPIGFDPLDPQSYLVGVTVTADANATIQGAMQGGLWGAIGHAAGSLDIQFQAEGPAFALLGMSAGDLRRGHIDLDKIARSIESHFTIANTIDVTNTHGDTTVHYLLQGPPVPLTDVHDGKKVPMVLKSIVAERPSTGQKVEITEWTMQFKGDGGHVLDGTIGMNVVGGTFPYHVKMTYPHRVDPDVDLACQQ